MTELGRRLTQLIAASEPIPLSQYMGLCQFDPAGGSYTARQTIGRDFITAPEISQTFGEMLGLWVAQTWHDQGRPEDALLVEMGPGRGTLMADALRAITAAAPELLTSAEVLLVEASPVLAAAQREKLKTSIADIDWCERFEDVPAGRPLFLIANEFFDCLPIRQFVKTGSGWHERMVGEKDGQLHFALAPDAIVLDVGAEAPIGAVFETAPSAALLMEEISRRIAAGGGGAVIIDYGYRKNEFGETLQAIQDGKPVDVLAAPGMSDLSAHVDFSVLKTAAEAGGCRATGPVTQCNFLADLGIGERGERLIMANPLQAKELAAAIDRLVNPAEMGALFQALAATPAKAPTPPGFGLG